MIQKKLSIFDKLMNYGDCSETEQLTGGIFFTKFRKIVKKGITERGVHSKIRFELGLRVIENN